MATTEPWGVQILQAIWFRGSVADHFNADILYRALTDGLAPDASQTNQMPNPTVPFFSQAQGVFNSQHLTLTISPGRLDLQAIRPDEVAGTPAVWPATEAWERLDSLLRKAADSKIVEKASRLALNVYLLRASSSAEEAASWLAKKAGVALDIPDPLDLIFQLNRRRESSSLVGVGFNRLLRFSTSTIQQFSMVMPPQGGGATIAPTMVQPTEQHFANLLVDVNTVPTGREFAPDEQAKLFTELAAECKALGDDGTLKALAAQ